jgi:hypothetical protein
MDPPVLKFVPVQEVALLADQVRVAEPPVKIEVGFTLMVTTGAPGFELQMVPFQEVPVAQLEVTYSWSRSWALL